MVKTLSLIKRRPDLSREAFREHYESVHAPLAVPLMKGLDRYVRYHVESVRHGEVVFDVLSGFWYRDADAPAATMERLEGEDGRGIREDEQKFMDAAGNRFFAVSERLLVDGEEGEGHLFVLVAKPEAQSRSECSTRLVRDHWPELEELLAGVEFALLRDAFPVAGTPLPWNAVLQVRAAEDAGLDAWAARREREGYRIAAVRTRRFESELASA